MLGFEPFKKRYQGKRIEEGVEETAMYQRVGIEPVHYCGINVSHS